MGVASGQVITAVGTPLTPVPARDGIPDWDAVDALVREWQPQALVVGNPLNMDGSVSELSHLALKFARRLAARYPRIPVYRQDERLSTREARATLAEVGQQRRGRLPSLDSTAACHILASWYAEPNWLRV
ncbi:UNVERIFIED_CONTAM: pre-16S rRNA nuclease [Trichonephila clavipes]